MLQYSWTHNFLRSWNKKCQNELKSVLSVQSLTLFRQEFSKEVVTDIGLIFKQALKWTWLVTCLGYLKHSLNIRVKLHNRKKKWANSVQRICCPLLKTCEPHIQLCAKPQILKSLCCFDSTGVIYSSGGYQLRFIDQFLAAHQQLGSSVVRIQSA